MIAFGTNKSSGGTPMYCIERSSPNASLQRNRQNNFSYNQPKFHLTNIRPVFITNNDNMRVFVILISFKLMLI